MSTVGPLKNLDHDPRDLSGPEIDFGKMTIISASQEMGKESHFNETFSKNLPSGLNEESDVESDGVYLAPTDLINHDITSLTRLQKVKEVISHQHKSMQDISNESLVARARLDLKDIESASDSRYKG